MSLSCVFPSCGSVASGIHFVNGSLGPMHFKAQRMRQRRAVGRALALVADYREDLVVAVECVFT